MKTTEWVEGGRTWEGGAELERGVKGLVTQNSHRHQQLRQEVLVQEVSGARGD